MTEHDILIPVILSGGTGTRLWPISRESHPKQFIKLPDGQTLLQKTYLRACHFPNTPEIITITNKEYYLKHKSDYEKTNPTYKPSLTSFLLEPSARNTAPAIALAALKVIENYGPEALLLILPADHLVEDIQAFIQDCQTAISLAKNNKIVTFGINPSYPETGYGYIECGEALTTNEHCHQVLRFVEKPNIQLANIYFNSKRYLWNSGMFCFKAAAILQEFAQHAGKLLNDAKACWEVSQKKNIHPAIFELDGQSFANVENISIDYALLEKSQQIIVVSCQFDWRDIGSWEAYKMLHKADHNGNTILGDVILIDSQDNFIHSEGRMVASIGVSNLAIIDTPDALLITHRERAQDVKHVVETLKHNAHETYLTHRTVLRPWGSYTILEEGPAFKIKRIVVDPNASLSLQMHQYRSEHWIVVSGVANVVNGDKEYQLQTNESTFVPMGSQHRLSNPGNEDLIIIEVQTGSYLGEDDIVRIEDSYGRVNNITLSIP